MKQSDGSKRMALFISAALTVWIVGLKSMSDALVMTTKSPKWMDGMGTTALGFTPHKQRRQNLVNFVAGLMLLRVTSATRVGANSKPTSSLATLRRGVGIGSALRAVRLVRGLNKSVKHNPRPFIADRQPSNGLAVLFSLKTSSNGGVGNGASSVGETGKESDSANG
jgi:hypothetical protein